MAEKSEIEVWVCSTCGRPTCEGTHQVPTDLGTIVNPLIDHDVQVEKRMYEALKDMEGLPINEANMITIRTRLISLFSALRNEGYTGLEDLDIEVKSTQYNEVRILIKRKT